MGQNLPPDQNFSSPVAGGSPQQPYQMQSAYQMQSPYVSADMFKQSREQPFAARGMGGNFRPQEFFHQEQIRQMANVSYQCIGT